VEADLLASIAEDDSEKAATEHLIGRQFALNVTHIGWFTRGVRDMRPFGEVFNRPV
jgi:hypothetical protein